MQTPIGDRPATLETVQWVGGCAEKTVVSKRFNVRQNGMVSEPRKSVVCHIDGAGTINHVTQRNVIALLYFIQKLGRQEYQTL